jgi:hypothetical protein
MSVEKARLELETLRDRATALQQELRDVEDRAVKLSNYIEISSSYNDRSASSGPQEASPLPVRAIGMLRAERALPKNVRAVVSILEAAGKPLPTRVLIEKLAEQGIVIGGKLPVTGLSSALSRHRELLTASRSEGWGLTAWSNQDSAKPVQSATENNNKPKTGLVF